MRLIIASWIEATINGAEVAKATPAAHSTDVFAQLHSPERAQPGPGSAGSSRPPWTKGAEIGDKIAGTLGKGVA